MYSEHQGLGYKWYSAVIYLMFVSLLRPSCVFTLINCPCCTVIEAFVDGWIKNNSLNNQDIMQLLIMANVCLCVHVCVC